MKKELSSLDLRYLVKELSILNNAKVNKLYQYKSELLIDLHIPSKGKFLLKIFLPNLIYITSHKRDYSAPSGFSMFLRKNLTNARLRKISQIDSERILDIEIEKEKIHHLIIELFSKGNIILCRSDYKILGCLSVQKWSNREIKKGNKYIHPERPYNLFKIKEDELKDLIENSNKDSVVKILAVDLGIGGLYAEELCLLAKIDKNKKDLDKKEIKKLYEKLKKLINNKPEPGIYENGDIVPFKLKQFKNLKFEKFKTFNEAIDDKYGTIENVEKTKHNLKLDKIDRIIKEQNEKIKELEKKAEEDTKKGELIYEKYQQIDSLIKELKDIRKKHSWKEIKDKLKNHKIIKKIDEKNNKIIIDV
jgi:predicted ribosome quality control (RQC) complex YloA/Tae2 family protein